MDLREKLAVILVSVVGLLGLIITLSHAIYLGFNLWYAYPFMLVGLALAGLFYGLPRFAVVYRKWASPRRVLLAIICVGAVLRVIMMLNPDALPDEWTTFFIVKQVNPFDVANFVHNFNTVTSPFSYETTPLPFMLLKLGYLISPTLQGTRLFPVILNTLLIPVAYYLARELSSVKVAQIVAFLFAINPASIYFLDAADTDIFLFFFGMAGLLFFIRGYNQGSVKQIILSGLMFGLAFWSKAALPEIWLGMAAVFTFTVLARGGNPRKLLYLGAVVLIALVLIAPWSAADPQSFNSMVVATPLNVVNQLSDFTGLNFGGSGTVVPPSVGSTSTIQSTSAIQSTSTSLTSTQQSGLLSNLLKAVELQNIIPFLQYGTGEFTSYIDIIAQVPVWYNPVAIVLGILFLLYGLFAKQKRGLHLAILIWVVGVLIALLAVQRDIRYFVDVATFPVIFAAAEATQLRRRSLARAFEILVVSFAIIFLAIGIVVGFELYGGVAEASQFVNQNYPHSSALVNYGSFNSLLAPGSKVDLISSNLTTLGANLSSTRYDVVLLWYQARTTANIDQYSGVLSQYYAHHANFGLSNYSYVTVYYDYVGK